MFTLSSKTKRTIGQLLPFALIWLLSGWTFLFVEVAATTSLTDMPVGAIQLNGPILLFASIAMAVVGVLMGLVEFRFLNPLFANQSFGIRFGGKLLVYYTLLFLLILILFPIAASMELGLSVLDRQVWVKYGVYLHSLTFVSTMLQLTVSLVLSLFYAEMNAFIGQKVLRNFFTGKYHTPVEEERIFMFLDMKASTTIAEQLGHVTYFRLLRAYYRCFTEAIVAQEGEVYQYVGDEIILSWGVVNPAAFSRCVACFFALKKALSSQKAWFEAQFELSPSFKAGIHMGKVTTGEIGVLKKEIMFTGDVLNATARIQGLCNDYGVDLLLSGDVCQKLPPDLPYTPHFLGQAELKGKVETMALYTLM
ncbi:MAG: adenylate/guanylate cyclase domain-containing protein [Bacteroidetes bacterium]|nr:MAG: adenylate/guanylate cyclase domain-containing protein [Bacteroidota bacterium]